MKFGISESVKSQVVQVCTPELFHRAVDSEKTGRVCAELADLLEACKRGELKREEYEDRKGALKKRLWVLTPHATFKNGRRKSEEAIPSGLSMYDVDHIPNPRGYWETKNEELKRKNSPALQSIVLAHITPSTEGLRLFFIMPKGMNLEQAQKWMSRELGDDHYDGCVKDLARCSFVVPREYILFIDEARLFAEQPVPIVADADGGTPDGDKPLPQEGTGGQKGQLIPTYRGIAYNAIIDEYFRQQGITVQQGDRNNQLFLLVNHLRPLTDNNPELILSILPRYGLPEEEVQALVRAACKKAFCPVSAVMKRVVAAVNEELKMKNEEFSEKTGLGNGNSSLFTLHYSFRRPPKMPKRLPRLIRHLLKHTPEIYKAPVAHAVFPPLGVHLKGVQFRYIDNVLHEPTLMNILMAPSGAGKSCINKPIGYIMADIKERDRLSLEREQQWKNEMNTQGANKDKRQRPEGLVVQMINPDITNAAFVLRLHEAQGHFLYTQMNELDMLDSLKGGGNRGQQFQIICLAFDQDNTYGQTRVGVQSVTHSVTVRFNWNSCTTIKKGRHYFRNVLVDGPLNRINFCTIPEQEIGAEMPIYGTYDEQFARELKPYIDRLNGAQGIIDCPEAHRLACELREECAEFARLSESRVYENFSFRALVIAWLKACVLYVANGCKWEEEMDDFIRWSLQYDLWCKMEFFGEAVERAQQLDLPADPQRGMRNMLEMLPNVFTLQQLTELRLQEGKNPDKTKEQLKKWGQRGYIERVENEQHMYRKLKYLRDE